MHCDPYVKLLLRRANCLSRRAQGGFAPVGTSPTTCWPWVLPDVDGSPAPAVFWGAFLGDCLHGGYQLLVALHSSSVHRHQVVERPHDRRLPSSQRRRRLHCSVRAGAQLGGVWPETPFSLPSYFTAGSQMCRETAAPSRGRRRSPSLRWQQVRARPPSRGRCSPGRRRECREA